MITLREFAGLFNNEQIQSTLDWIIAATAEFEEIKANPPLSDDNGRWPRFYVEKYEKAEKQVSRAHAELGRYVDYILSLAPIKTALSDVAPTDLLEIKEREGIQDE